MSLERLRSFCPFLGGSGRAAVPRLPSARYRPRCAVLIAVMACERVGGMSTDSSGSQATVSSIWTRDVGPALRSEIVRLCVAAHREQDFENLFTYLPGDGLHVLAADAEQVVGHAVVTTRWLQPGTLPPLRTAYVDAVATSPGHQGRGIGTAVMRYLADAVADFDLACLEADRPGFYERLGWQEWRGPLGGRSEQGLIATPDQAGIMILRLPATPRLDPSEQLTIEATDVRIW
jgi:aminoglycoside 2'-N-acetyltransferase I